MTVQLFIDGEAVNDARIPRYSSHLSFWGLDVAHIPNSTFSSRVAAPFALPARILDRIDMIVHPAADDAAEYAEVLLASE